MDTGLLCQQRIGACGFIQWGAEAKSRKYLNSLVGKYFGERNCLLGSRDENHNHNLGAPWEGCPVIA